MGREVAWFSDFHKRNSTASISFSSGDLQLIQRYSLIHGSCSNFTNYPNTVLYNYFFALNQESSITISCHVDQSFFVVHDTDMTSLVFHEMCPNLGCLHVSS